MTYSLEELAHYHRCWFPQDYYSELIEQGLDETKAAIIRHDMMTFYDTHQNYESIIDFAHSYRKLPEYHAAIIKHLDAHVLKFRK